MTAYPEHERQAAVLEDSALLTDFLDWLIEDGQRLGRWVQPQPGWRTRGFVPTGEDYQRLLERYFKIDPNKIEAERRAMLTRMAAEHARRAAQEGPPAPRTATNAPAVDSRTDADATRQHTLAHVIAEALTKHYPDYEYGICGANWDGCQFRADPSKPDLERRFGAHQGQVAMEALVAHRDQAAVQALLATMTVDDAAVSAVRSPRDGALAVDVDAPAGVRVRIHINDWLITDTTIPADTTPGEPA